MIAADPEGRVASVEVHLMETMSSASPSASLPIARTGARRRSAGGAPAAHGA